MSNPLPLDVSGLVLRPICVEDAGKIHEWASQPQACRYQPWGPNTRSETDAFVEAAVNAWYGERPLRRVWVAVGPGKGVVGLGELKQRSATTAEIAYAVHTRWWGAGLATEIAALIIEFAITKLSMERVQATCDPRNRASAAVLDKIGMSFEGTMRHTLYLRDGWRDSEMHSILSSEWSRSLDRLGRIAEPVRSSGPSVCGYGSLCSLCSARRPAISASASKETELLSSPRAATTWAVISSRGVPDGRRRTRTSTNGWTCLVSLRDSVFAQRSRLFPGAVVTKCSR